MQDFSKLKVWQRAHHVTLSVYRASARFPSQEAYGVTSQLRRSCASVAANIAEGCGRRGRAEFARFLDVAMGSASEARYHLLLARDLRLIGPSEHEELASAVIEVKRMLAGLIARLRTDN